MIRDLRPILSIRGSTDAPAEPRSDVIAHADTGAPTTPNQAASDQPGSSLISAWAILRAEEQSGSTNLLPSKGARSISTRL